MKQNVVEPFFEAIISAIVAELKCRKLLQSYINAGIDMSMFEPNLYRTVFPLVGINTELQYTHNRDWYEDQIERILDIDIADTEKINVLAGEILVGLMERRKQLKS
ncbi:hypothetical protein [Pedobacter sp.]